MMVSGSSGMGGTSNPLLSSLPASAVAADPHHQTQQQGPSAAAVNPNSSVINANATAPSEINRVMAGGGLQQVSTVTGGGQMATGGLISGKLIGGVGGGVKKRSNDKKTCRWVLDNGTVCGRAFSKFDSLRRHVTELHKGVRPFACKLCDKTYGRKDYLDRHVKSHTAASTAAAGMVTVGSESVVGAKPSLIVHHSSNDVLASGGVMLDDDDDDDDDHHIKAAELMSGDVVTVVGAVDDEDDELAV